VESEPTRAEIHAPATPQPEAPVRTFPVEEFASTLDPAVVKARYLVGPIDPTIVFVGDLDERHGADLLMRAMPPILKNHPQTRLVIVGDGALIWPLRVMSRYMLLDHAVRIVGHVDGREVRELIAAADVVAVPSREKTEDWQILAGWSARRPVVASNDVSAHLCRHEEDSVLVYPNPGSCVWGLERVLYDAEFGRRIGARGYERVTKEFSGKR
jgi:glycosyltransferase involved in cell wall biosynthesis